MTNATNIKRQLNVLIICDDKPGHFNQSYGVIEALKKRLNIRTTQLQISGGFNGQLARWLAQQQRLPSWLRNRMAGVSSVSTNVGKPDLIISAGGRTLAGNISLAKHFSCPNIFSGSIRGINTDHFSAILHINPLLEDAPKHIIGLKPSVMEPNLEIKKRNPPKRLALLVGGPIDSNQFSNDEWTQFANKIADGRLNWNIITSRRTPTSWKIIFESLAKNHPKRIILHEYNKIGPGKVHKLLDHCDAAVISNDSASMISEAVATGLRTVSLTPKTTNPSVDEAYLQVLLDKNYYRSARIQDADEKYILGQLQQCQPMTTSHLDILCERLLNAIPELKGSEG